MNRYMPFAAAALLCGPAACSDDVPNSAQRERLSALPLMQRLANADAGNGAIIFRRCAACHTISAGAGDRGGPNLHGILGRPVASGSSRFGYTAALKADRGTWTVEKMDAWLADPRKMVPGTTMAFDGLASGADRADVIAYLKANGSKPDLR